MTASTSEYLQAWFLENFNADDFSDTYHVDLARVQDELSQVSVRPESIWGVCSRCNNPRQLSSFLYPIRGQEEAYVATENMCVNCLTGVLIYRMSGGNIPSWRVSTNLPAEMFAQPAVTRPTCHNCDGAILEREDHDVDSSSHFQGVATMYEDEHGDSQTIIVHQACSWQCRIEGRNRSCGRRFPNTIPGSGHWSPRNYVSGTYSGMLCPECTESQEDDLFTCDSCERYAWNDHSVYSEYRGADLCTDCYDNSYFECDECGSEYREGRNHRCHESDVSGVYHYGYKPSPVFHGEDRYYFGIELEMEAPNDDRGTPLADGVRTIHKHLGDRVYIKEDSSIEYGFEMVSHPHSLSEFQTNFDWRVLENLRSDGWRSWDTHTCGLHVHVSRTAFESSKNKVNRHMLKFIKFIYDNQRAVQALAGRESDYAKFNDKGRLTAKLELGIGDGHFSAVNTDPENTLEIRVFKGSLKPERVLSAIEFVHAAIEHTRTMKVSPKDKPMAWTKFISFVASKEDTYPHLIEIMERTLVGRRTSVREREE